MMFGFNLSYFVDLAFGFDCVCVFSQKQSNPEARSIGQMDCGNLMMLSYSIMEIFMFEKLELEA